jgi:hypothetical protein
MLRGLMPLEKLKKINEIREYFNLPVDRSTYFTKSQMVSVIKALRGDSHYVDSPVNNLFETNLATSGWVKQVTTDAQPSTINLDLLYNLTQDEDSSELNVELDLENTKVEQALIDRINSSELKTISLEEGLVKMTFL